MELTIDQALQEAIKAHKAGNAQEADRYYTSIIKANPKHPDANHNMGVLAVGIGKVQEALPFFKAALESNANVAQFWLSYIDALVKLDRLSEAKAIFKEARKFGIAENGFDIFNEKLNGVVAAKIESDNNHSLDQNQIQRLINLYTNGQFEKTLNEASNLLAQVPNSSNLHNIMGAANQGLGKLDDAIRAFKMAISINPEDAQAFNNMGIVLQDQGKLEEAVEAFNNAISIKNDFAEAYNNMGIAQHAQGKLDHAAKAFKTALSIKANYAEAAYNMGNSLQDRGKLDEAIDAFSIAISIETDFAKAHNNIGNAFQDRGMVNKAIESFEKAISIKLDYSQAHRNLSSLIKYTIDTDHFTQVKELYETPDLSEDARCNLSFALFKMYEDMGDFDQAFDYLSLGNFLRKKILKYSIETDKKLFSHIKRTQPLIFKNTPTIKKATTRCTPIFIVGMLRSGTTLVEQIISCHSKAAAAGEIDYVSKYGTALCIGTEPPTKLALANFREKYLSNLKKISNNFPTVIDKMPQNFRFIPLICAAFPEAKIIHVQRDAAATCWSNYKHYFVSNDLGYCYDLQDVGTYYELYRDLMKLWQSQYGDRIYNLNYESLTTDQENQTRKLIKYLELKWDNACLSPHKNKRSVRTASQQQVRQKVYQGSSKAWQKYESYLNGAFDSLRVL